MSAKLAAAIAWLRARNAYVLDKGSRAYTPVHGAYPPVPKVKK